ncbi:unnamed protein product [Nippostrongylus brasiliensis]|uniref:LisH domain-containing protein n=1 Tax=Nippostrongylus brasiliensis TaxID=27835 RepID=A0A0N4Y254_NIPBR|nr:unnamed protein product [Nippostrongylus brasiliensis]
MALNGTDRVVDKEYLALLESKLQALKDPKKATAKQFLSDIASYKDQQLFNLITAGSPTQSGFDDDFSDVVITPSYLRRVVAPQTCAINKQELVQLVKNDQVQKSHEAALQGTDLEQQSDDNKCCDDAVIDPSLNIHTCLINAYGRLHFVEQNKTVHLPKLLAEVPLENGHSIELSSADMSASSNQGCLAILATSWVELNEHFCPCRHFGALFKISPTLHVELMKKGDTLFWNSEIILSQSEQFDAITSACIIGDNIAVGTSSGKILFYSSPCDLLSHEISSMTQLHSPIVNMRVVDEKTLCVLSTAGLHTVKRSDV